MNYLEKVEIINFWGDRNLSINFNHDINFLIGVNGSGKTTVINMIAAALNADFPTLDRLSFSKLFLQLRAVRGNKKPSIEVEKRRQLRSPYPDITFKIRDKASAKPITYSLDEIEEERIYRARPDEYYHEYPVRYTRHLRETRRDVIKHLLELVKVSWLSIHRTPAPHRLREERSFESTVDEKLNEMSNELVKYFSQLDKMASLETDKFQQTIFLSLLSDESESQVFSLLSKLDYKQEKNSLIEIFKLFRLKESKFSKRVEKHFNTYASALDKMVDKTGMDLEDLTVLLGTRRIHSVVQEWKKLTNKQEKIYKPKNTFLKVINSLMQRKELIINDKNELEAKTKGGKIFPLKYLSSGEKQLLIILGEALLQQSVPWIYIADEPELSLHVTWQENLVTNLRNVNPNAQIIFATHSPDIVSSYDNCVFDMEKVIS